MSFSTRRFRFPVEVGGESWLYPVKRGTVFGIVAYTGECEDPKVVVWNDKTDSIDGLVECASVDHAMDMAEAITMLQLPAPAINVNPFKRYTKEETW